MCSPEALLLAAVSTVRWCWTPGTFSCSAVTRVEEEVVRLVTSEQGDTRSRAQGVAAYLQRYQHRSRELGPRHQVTPASVQHCDLKTVCCMHSKYISIS